MPTILVTLQNKYGEDTLLMPLPYKRIRGKYLYGPGANGKRQKPKALKPSLWQKIKDGYADLFNMVRGK